MPVTESSARFVAALNRRHGSERIAFTATAGARYDRIVINTYGSPGVHAFVDRETGAVHKPAGWSRPAPGVRFADVDAAIERSDPYGGYLYKKGV